MTLNAVRMAVGVLDPTTALTAFITSSSSRTTPGQTALDCQKLYCSLSVYIYSKSNLQNRTVSLFVLRHLTFCQKSFTWCALALCSTGSSQQEGPGSRIGIYFLCWPCCCPPPHVGFLWVLQLSPTVQTHASRGISKLAKVSIWV